MCDPILGPKCFVAILLELITQRYQQQTNCFALNRIDSSKIIIICIHKWLNLYVVCWAAENTSRQFPFHIRSERKRTFRARSKLYAHRVFWYVANASLNARAFLPSALLEKYEFDE